MFEKYLFLVILAVASVSGVAHASQGVQSSSGNTMVSYRDKGVDFYFDSSGLGIRQVYVYPAQNASHISVNQFSVVPGVGAYGVRIGGTEADLRSLRGVKQCKRSGYMQTGDSIICEFEDGRRLIISFVNVRVHDLVVFGRFRTPEGVTEKSTKSEVAHIYGKESNLPSACTFKTTRPLLRPLWHRILIMLLAGCAAGLCLRLVCGYKELSLTQLFTIGSVLGGSFSAIGYAVASIQIVHYASVMLSSILYVVVSAALAGGIATGIFLLMSARHHAPLLVLLLVLFVNILVTLVVRIIWMGSQNILQYLFITGIPLAIFMLGLVSCGWTGVSRRFANDDL